MYMSHFSSNELIFHKVGNEIISAGFGVNSILLSKGLSPILTFTSNLKNEESSSSDSDSDSDTDSEHNPKKSNVFRSFKNLAVPIGLYSTKTPKVSPDIIQDKYSHVTDDIYEELLKLSEYRFKPKQQSKKRQLNNKTNNKTNKKTKTYKHNK